MSTSKKIETQQQYNLRGQQINKTKQHTKMHTISNADQMRQI